MIMVFHNKNSESMAMQIAEKMISKRLKHNFNDRVFDVFSGTIIEHTATVSIKFYKVNYHTFMIHTFWVILISEFRVLRTLVLRGSKITMKLASALFLRTNTYARIQTFFKAWFHNFDLDGSFCNKAEVIVWYNVFIKSYLHVWNQ